MKLILTAALLLVGCASNPNPPIQLSERAASLVETDFGYGSAWPITSDCYLTAWHVVSITNDRSLTEEGYEPSTVFVAGTPVLQIIRIEGLDAALLVMASEHGQEPWRLDTRSLRPAEDIFISGWGHGMLWWSRGLGTNQAHRVSVCIAPGDSGGPVLDVEGDVVGIIIGKYTPQHHTVILPIADIVSRIPDHVMRGVHLDPSGR